MKKTLLIILSILLLLSIPVTVFWVGKQQEIRSKATPATAISLAPSTIVKAVDDTFSVDVIVDTGGNQASLASIDLVFDADILEAQSITKGTLFSHIYTQGTTGDGTASIVVGIEHNTKPVTGTGTAATVRFKAKAATTSPVSIQFGTATRVVGLGESTPDLLVSRTPATVTITSSSGPVLSGGGGTTTSTPTQTPMPTVSVSSSYIPLSISALSVSASQSQSPTFTGKAMPGTTVLLTAPATTLSTTVVADASGVWSYTPNNAFAPGTYTLIAMAKNSITGNTETISTILTVANPNASGARQISVNEEAAGSPMPISGSTSTTILLLVSAGTILLLGILTPLVKNS